MVFGLKANAYLDLKANTKGIADDSTWDELAEELKWDKMDTLDDKEKRDKIREIMLGVSKWFVGTSAMHQLIHAVHNNRFTAEKKTNSTEVKNLVAAAVRFATPATQCTPKIFMELGGYHDEKYSNLAAKWYDMANCMKFLKYGLNPKDNTVKDIDQYRIFGTGNRAYYGITVGNLIILRGASEYVNRGLIITSVHASLLAEVCNRISNLYAYISTDPLYRSDKALVVTRMIDHIITTAFNCNNESARWVARAYHKAKAINQMRILANEQTGAEIDLLEDYTNDNLHKILDLTEYNRMITACPLKSKLDVMNVYKILPPSDIDSFTTFRELKGWHMNTRPSGADDGASKVMRDNWDRITYERKVNFINAYKARFGDWPLTLEFKGNKPSPDEIKAWDVNNTLLYESYGKDITAQVKDKAIVPPLMSTLVNGQTRGEDRSFLLWYMAGADNINTDSIAADYKTLDEQNYVLVADKFEAHKPNGRLFSVATPKRRIMLGELEGNLSLMAKHYPGSLQGKSSLDKAKHMHSIMDIYDYTEEAALDIVTTMYLVTFDLSKFSPKSNGNVTKDYHQFWAKAYNMPHITSMYEIGCESEILMNRCGYVDSYRNRGADIEGFRGRMMTMFHCDMLAAAIRLARERGYVAGKGKLACFIDDGIVKVHVVGINAVARANANGFLNCMQEIYAAAGQEAHPNKTMLSKIGGEMLSDQYYHSRKLPCGLKAALKLGPDYENPAVAITEDLDALFASSQGAVKAGADWIASYHRYLDACIMTIIRWAHHASFDPTKFALKLFTPKSYGGFGIQGFQNLVTTNSVNLTLEGITMLNRAGRMFPELRSMIQRVVTQPIVQRDVLGILRDPTRIRASTSVLVENRLTMKIVKWMEESGGKYKSFLGAYRNVELKAHAKAVANAILGQASVFYPFIVRAWKSTPLAYVESVVGKFKRAKTIIDVLGYTTVGNIRKRNMEDLKKVLISL